MPVQLGYAFPQSIDRAAVVHKPAIGLVGVLDVRHETEREDGTLFGRPAVAVDPDGVEPRLSSRSPRAEYGRDGN
ncbi:MAG TPA: hypothetical protein VJL29_00870 [Thermoguttaceae bacterium]|nr:hypothetical protein [Thermoguttaceae bacterium]